METTQPAVLIVDDDRGTCETVDWALRPAGVHVEMAASGAEGLALARSLQFELLLIDLCLPDMLGTALIRTLVGERRSVPFVLLSGFLTTEVTVEAMKLGASDVFEKPVAIETLCETVDAVIARRPPGSHDNGTASGSCPMSAAVAGMRPRSAAERWAVHVLKGCEADGDLNTLRNWAECSGVSVSSLAESCHLLGIPPRDGRDFTRLLRALIKSVQYDCDLRALLDVSDRRTLATLLERGGVGPPLGKPRPSVDRFLDRQQFVAAGNDGLRVLRAVLRSRR